MITVRYSSNNSGGVWWLSDEDWKNLEAAGWNVQWGEFGVKGYRYMGALAAEATLECTSIEDAVRSFEQVTGQDANAEGCSCCGRPHCFSAEGP